MSKVIGLGRRAGAIYFALTCILAASLLVFRFRRVPNIVIQTVSQDIQSVGDNVKVGSTIEDDSEELAFVALAGISDGVAEPKDTGASAKTVNAEESTITKANMILVHVAGQVVKPGLYELAIGSRVHHAIEAAGGMSDLADKDSVNIALPISDGQQVYIPKKNIVANVTVKPLQVEDLDGKEPKEASEPIIQETKPNLPINRIDVYQEKPAQVEDANATGKPGAPIDLNSAGQVELETLPGIGPSLASRIIEYRNANGPFKSIDAIMDVSGIGPAKFAAIKGLVVVY